MSGKVPEADAGSVPGRGREHWCEALSPCVYTNRRGRGEGGLVRPAKEGLSSRPRILPDLTGSPLHPEIEMLAPKQPVFLNQCESSPGHITRPLNRPCVG